MKYMSSNFAVSYYSGSSQERRDLIEKVENILSEKGWKTKKPNIFYRIIDKILFSGNQLKMHREEDNSEVFLDVQRRGEIYPQSVDALVEVSYKNKPPERQYFAPCPQPQQITNFVLGLRIR